VLPDSTLNIFSATHLGSAKVNISERDCCGKIKTKLIFVTRTFFAISQEGLSYQAGRGLTSALPNTLLPNIPHYLF
jgi:hypothetical protein